MQMIGDADAPRRSMGQCPLSLLYVCDRLLEDGCFGLWRHSSIHLMARLAVVRPKASRDEVRAHRAAIRRLVDTLGLGTPRIRGDGTVIVHSQEAGYRAAARLSAMASDVVGRDVHVITDDVAGAAGAQEL